MEIAEFVVSADLNRLRRKNIDRNTVYLKHLHSSKLPQKRNMFPREPGLRRPQNAFLSSENFTVATTRSENNGPRSKNGALLGSLHREQRQQNIHCAP